jgi:DNA-directed RNA polymerase subunit RPC12/RpoP
MKDNGGGLYDQSTSYKCAKCQNKTHYFAQLIYANKS